jgi:hypothetical protein
MNEILLELTDEEFSRVSLMPCADAALEICRIHFRRVDVNAHFNKPGKGADLRVRFQNGVETDVEVKGTGKVGIAWNQFKVSSQQSHDLLVKGIPLYRVTGIGSRAVKIFIMKHGVDFAMSPELRWTVHQP